MKLRAILLCAALAAASLTGGLRAQAAAPLTPALVFADNMVLQADAPVAVFGTGESGRMVTVSFGEQRKSAPIANGEWCVTLDPMAASFAARVLEIGDGSETIRFTGVTVGEVWFCSGQSNMALSLSVLGDKAGEYDETFDNFEKIRVMSVPYRDGAANNGPLPRMTWIKPASTADLRDHSAYAVAAALELQRKLGVPIGVMISAVGGSCIEEWLDEATIAETGSIASTMGKVDSRFYKNMVEFLLPYTVGGIFWYQGEANSGEQGTALYPKQFEGYVKMYRNIWGGVPVVYAQLPGYKQPDGAYWREFREMQWKLMRRIDDAYAVCGIDLGNALDIHPTDKLPFGIRAGDLAAVKAYGAKEIGGLSPYPSEIIYAGNTVTVQYTDGEGLTKKDAQKAVGGFELLTPDGTYVQAEAEIANGAVTIASNVKPLGVRYAWELKPEINLYNKYGLPAAPFTLALSEKTYTVTVTAGAGGGVDRTEYTVAGGGKAVITPAPDEGYEVASVKVNGKAAYYAGGAFTTPAVHADMTVEILFRPIRARFSVTISVAGEGSVSPQQGTVCEGETFIFAATPAEGYRIGAVRAGDSELTGTDGRYTLTVTGDTSIAVEFVKTEKGCGAAAGTGTPAGGAVLLAGLAVVCRRKPARKR